MQDVFSVPVLKAGIVFISSTFYGLFFVLFALSTLILNRQCKGRQISSTNIYLASSYLMFIVLSAVSASINPSHLKSYEPVNRFGPFLLLCVSIPLLSIFQARLLWTLAR